MVNKEKVNVMVLGAGGQLGQTYADISDRFDWAEFVFLNRSQADVTVPSSIAIAIDQYQPQFIINCAAYTAVDKAENDVPACVAANTDACQNILKAINGKDIKIIHFSSDYVYHTYQGLPLQENDETKPQGQYAIAKLAGEKILMADPSPTLIFRVSWLVSPFAPNFVTTMMKLGHDRSELNVVNDQYGAPTYTYDLAAMTMSIVHKSIQGEISDELWNDVYNYACEGVVTWYDIAKLVMQQGNIECKVNPIPSSQYPTPAKRPHWSVMSKHKIKRAFGVDIPHWRESIIDCVEKVLKQNKI